MRLTTFTDYALRVLIYLAVRRERRVTIDEIARSYSVSKHHVAKVVHFLGASGWVDNLRGRGGGVRLAVPPASINVAEVVRLAEGGDEPAECFSAGRPRCAIAADCLLRGVLGNAVDAFYASLAKKTLEDLVVNRGAIVRMLRMPTPKDREHVDG
jgi:Rrf2 family nitric oxide-sensitive transcriptional repressor